MSVRVACGVAAIVFAGALTVATGDAAGRAPAFNAEALTDDEGRYQVTNLPRGRYRVTFSKAGFVSLEYGQRRPGDPPTVIELGDREMRDRVDAALPRGGAIEGRVAVRAGEDTVGVDIVRRPVPFARVSGTVVGSRGPLREGTFVTLARARGPALAMPRALAEPWSSRTARSPSSGSRRASTCSRSSRCRAPPSSSSRGPAER